MTEILHKLRIPEGDIVVTRKVPMTNETCTKLRRIKADVEVAFAAAMNVDVGQVQVEIPTIIENLIDAEHERRFPA
jgi:metal-sulfur cluster biosynthetic enzyme